MKTKSVCNPIIYWKLNESTHSSGTSVFQPPPFLMMSAAILNLDWHSNRFKKRPNKLFKLQIVEKTDSGSVNDQSRSLITFDLTSKKQYFLKFVWGTCTRWFFTRNTKKQIAPLSALRNFFKCAPPPQLEILDPPLQR